MIVALAWVAAAAWVYLIVARGGFWRANVREELRAGRSTLPAPARWPAVTAIIPARNEAETIGAALRSLMRQHYPGTLRIIVVDDRSEDGTAAAAWNSCPKAISSTDVEIISGVDPPPGWTGKVWAQKQGIDRAILHQPDYLLLTDADIAYAPNTLRDLVSRAEQHRLVLTSVMAKLHCVSFAERCIIPAFVHFFQMLYPFDWVNRRDKRTAAAAGGCMLVRRHALAQAGGIASIRSEIIDDCALARRLKAVGPIWLGLSHRVLSLRASANFEPLRRMVTRSAYAQLGYSPLLLVATFLAMGLVFAVPPVLATTTSGTAMILGTGTFMLMAASFIPILRFYRLAPFWCLALPLVAMLYSLWTVESAVQYARGRGGMWKGRIQALPTAGAS